LKKKDARIMKRELLYLHCLEVNAV